MATGTTIYVGALYEKNVSTAVETSYYFAGSNRIAMKQGGVLYYFAADHLGSTSLTMGPSGNTTMGYKPFGETRYGNTPTDRRFTGQRSEEATLGSLYDYGARFYSPVLGRFLSADTVVPDQKNPQAWNRYAYTVNNPLKYKDPTGHCWFLCAVIGAAVGAIAGAVSYTANAIINRTGWNSDDYWGSVAGGAGAGALAGGTLGGGTALVGSGIAAQSAGTTLVGTALVGSGTGEAIGAGVTMLDSVRTGQKLDGTDFAINTAVGGIGGALQALVPGSGSLASIARVGIGSLVAGGGSVASDLTHGGQVDADKAFRTAVEAGVLGILGEGITGATMDPKVGIATEPYSPLALWQGKMAQQGSLKQMVDNLAYQIPLNFVGDDVSQPH